MGEAEIQGLIALALNKWTMLNAGGVFFFLRVVGRSPIAKFSLYQRLLPVLPEAMAIGAMLAGGNPVIDKQPLVVKIMAGLWCGYLAQRFHKVLGQTILGDDKAIAAKKTARLPAGPEEGK